jgi:hypothetical protein
MATAVTN